MKVLTSGGCLSARAALYADAYLEYKEAQTNITNNGSIVADPRTGSPIQNPYLAARDKVFVRLESLHGSGLGSNLAVLWDQEHP